MFKPSSPPPTLPVQSEEDCKVLLAAVNAERSAAEIVFADMEVGALRRLLFAYPFRLTPTFGLPLLAYPFWPTPFGLPFLAYPFWPTLFGLPLLAFPFWPTPFGFPLLAYPFWLLPPHTCLRLSPLKPHPTPFPHTHRHAHTWEWPATPHPPLLPPSPHSRC
jgi:hypothetical protein